MENEAVKELKKITLEEYQFYNRRYEQVCLIISGFGLYACLEFGKIVFATKLKLHILLYAATCFALSIVLALITLRLEKRIREYYLQLFYDEGKNKINAAIKSRKLENIGIRLDWVNLFVTALAVILLIVAAVIIFTDR